MINLSFALFATWAIVCTVLELWLALAVGFIAVIPAVVIYIDGARRWGWKWLWK